MLQQTATVLPGGTLEIVRPELHEGQTVDVVVRRSPPSAGRSAVDILAEAPGQRLFETGNDVDDYIREERTPWNRRRFWLPGQSVLR